LLRQVLRLLAAMKVLGDENASLLKKVGVVLSLTAIDARLLYAAPGQLMVLRLQRPSTIRWASVLQ
jgi:hypothetical protein